MQRRILGAWALAIALALQPASAWAQPAAPQSTAKAVPPRADGFDVYGDTPPPSAFDRAGDMPGVAETLRKSGPGLLTQLLRTVVALVAVLALLVASVKIILPRLMRGVAPKGRHRGAGLMVTDRLVLDGRNTLVQVQLAHGPRYLIACGDHGTTLVDRLPASSDAAQAPVAGFADHMGRPTSKE